MSKEIAAAIKLLQKAEMMPSANAAEAVAAVDEAIQLLITARRDHQGPDTDRGGGG